MPSAKFIVANWKANKTESEMLAWWAAFSAAKFSKKGLHVVICPPYIHLFPLRKKLAAAQFPFPVTLGTQDLSGYPDGAYTGEVTARMVSGIVTHAILGHSERRQWLGETPQAIAQKTIQALDYSITPIIAVDRQSFRRQIAQFDDRQLKKIIVMYEPPDAISLQEGPAGRGRPAEQQDVETAVKQIKLIAPDTPILYGGSVKSQNVRKQISFNGIEGVVVGTASRNADEFIRLINQI